MAIIIFLIFISLVLFISSRAGKKATGMGGYFAANNTIHWGVNGIAFAGGYLSVASFLGIAGLIAFFGYDGFLYSIGFLAGWIVALFVIAEPMKRMGTFTFSDALNKNFNRPGIQLAAGVSVLVVSLFYLIPQMVGAGVLVEPLFGVPHYWGVIVVGAVVIIIVASGGMTSTTWVQFFNGGLLLTFALVLTIAVLIRGINTVDLPKEEGHSNLENYQFEKFYVETENNTLTKNSLVKTSFIDVNIIDKKIIYDIYTDKPTLIFYKLSRLVPITKEPDNMFSLNIKGRNVIIEKSNDIEIISKDNNNFYRLNDWWRLDFNSNEKFWISEVQSR